jgi:hypothetical protein
MHDKPPDTEAETTPGTIQITHAEYVPKLPTRARAAAGQHGSGAGLESRR